MTIIKTATHTFYMKRKRKKNCNRTEHLAKSKKKIGNVFGDPRIESLFAFQMVVVITVNFVLA